MVANKWKKGEPSPNPSGRPKRKPIEEELLRLIDEQASAKDKRTHARRIAEAIVKAAGKGNVKAFMAVADRVDGRVPLAVTEEAEQTLQIHVIDVASEGA